MKSSTSPLDTGSRPLDQLTLLYAVADAVQRLRDVEVIFDQAVAGLRRAVAVDGVVLQVAEGGLLRMVASSGVSAGCASGLEGFAPWPTDGRDAATVATTEVATDPRLDPVRSTLESEGVGALACVPLLHRSRPMGVLQLLRRSAQPFEETDLRLASALSGQLAFAIWRGRTDVEQAELLRRFEVERSVLESVVKQMPAGVLLADVPSGRIILSNSRANTIWGGPLERARGIEDYAAWRGYDPAGRSLAGADWPLARSVRHGETVQGEDIEIEGARGRRVIRMSSAPVVDSQGRRLAAVATVNDVTEERDATGRRGFVEMASRALSESLEPAATMAALGRVAVGRYADWCVIHQRLESDRLTRVAATCADPARAELVRPLASGSIDLASVHPVAQAVRTGRSVVTEGSAESRRAVLQEGDEALPAELLPSSVMVFPLMARGRGLGALTVVRTRGVYEARDQELFSELAGRAALALDNALLYEQARTADRQKSSFLAVMSHEFRTPLSAILGYADILTAEVHGELNPKQRTHVDRVKASVRHLSHLVDEILSYASMEAGRERIRTSTVDAVAVVGDAVELMEPIAETAGLTLRVRTPPEPLELVTDPSKLRQILINLVSNGIKYTTSGQVELVLEQESSVARFRVLDTGPGIPEAHLEDVFEPFWQVESGDGRWVSGSGLGLAVARRLSRLMGGDISLTSVVGQGSEFVVELPLAGPDGVAGPDPS